MNPCNNCYLYELECHESGFADQRCEAWRRWKTELLIFKVNEKLRVQELNRKKIDARQFSRLASLAPQS